jgi:lysophospholipase L1-like esterase
LAADGEGIYSERGENIRMVVNEWIRTTRLFYAVADFDRLLRDPEDPTRLRAIFDSGDHLHPNDTAYYAMAKAIDLSISW